MTDTQTPPFDLGPATEQLAGLVTGVREDQLTDPTPCPDLTVGDLLDHIHLVSQAFRAVAAKEDLPGLDQPPPPGRAADLPEQWRAAMPDRLAELAAAWRVPEAWTGMGTAGGVTMPTSVLGVVALAEVVLHGWDLARATGQAFDADPVRDAVLAQFTDQLVSPDGPPPGEGPYGPPLEVPIDATPFERTLRNAGRDPAWTA